MPVLIKTDNSTNAVVTETLGKFLEAEYPGKRWSIRYDPKDESKDQNHQGMIFDFVDLPAGFNTGIFVIALQKFMQAKQLEADVTNYGDRFWKNHGDDSIKGLDR